MRIRTVIIGAAAAAAAAYLFDPRGGSSRRDRLGRLIRSSRAEPLATDRSPSAPENLAPMRPTPSEPVPAVEPTPTQPAPTGSASTTRDDTEIVRTVRTKLDQRRDLQTDDLVIDVVNGVAYLSGDLRDRQTFGEIVDLTRATPGVRRVQSLLHLPHSQTITPLTEGAPGGPIARSRESDVSGTG